MTDLLTMLATKAKAPRATSARSRKAPGERKQSKTAQFLAWVRDQADASGVYDTPLPLLDLARAWCDGAPEATPPVEAHYPSGPGRKTPWATLSATIGTLAQHGEMPPGIRLVSKAEHAASLADMDAIVTPIRALIVTDLSDEG